MRPPLIKLFITIAVSAGISSHTAAQSEVKRPASTVALLNQMWSQGQATGRGPVKLANFSLRLEDIDTIIPMGLVAGGHVTPSDHLYVVPKKSENKDQRYDVLAAADGYVVNIQWRPKGNLDPTAFDREVDLKVIIEHSATCWSYVDHLPELDETLRSQVSQPLKPGQPIQVRIPVKAGQVIGKVGNATYDFAFIDTATTRKGFVRPEQFLRRDPWKLHTVDPFDYVDEPLKGKLLALNPRKAAPRGGRMDYDVDGKLAGNWFQIGTEGYAGANRRVDYWVGHVAFVYHHIEPTNVVISIGNYAGQARQFWVKGNAPDPASIGEKNGPEKYELIYGRLGSSGQMQIRHDADVVQGVVLAQVLPERKLKLEIFPRTTAAEVKGFTEAARVYER